MEGTIANLSSLVTIIAQLGMAAGAWRLANALRVRVDDHESRINHHESRLSRLETKS